MSTETGARSRPERSDGLPPVEEAIARLVVDLDFEDIPDSALTGVRRLLEDQLGLQVGCVSLPWNVSILDLIRSSHAPGRSHITLAGRDTFSAADAAFVNATYGHSFEYDDAHEASFSHPGSCVVSAALAVGEELGARMADVVTGIVAGYEVYTRIGILIGPGLLERGFHPHAVLANFGAAAVAAKMRGFDVPQTVNALSIASSHASGTTEYSSGGGSVKRVHAGIGTRNGIFSADLARAGITGPPAFLTGSKGLSSTFLQASTDENSRAIFTLEREFEIAKVCIKSYCCCYLNHAYIDGARRLTGPRDDITSVRLRVKPGADVIIGNRNEHAFAPQRLDHLQYSLPFQFSLATLGYGNGFSVHHQYFENALDLGPGSEVANLADKITIEVAPDLEVQYPGRWVADIEVEHSGGDIERVFVDDPSGTTENPVSQEQLDEKFSNLTVPLLGQDGSVALREAIQGLDPDQSIEQFAALLQTGGR